MSVKFIGRIAGTVTYTDNSTDFFAAHLDDQGNVIINDSMSFESNRAILELQSDEDWLESLLALLDESLAMLPSGVASSDKTVSDAVVHISGRIARDDDTWEDFAVQYDSTDNARILPTSGSINVFSEFFEPTIRSWFGATMLDGEVVVGEPTNTLALTFNGGVFGHQGAFSFARDAISVDGLAQPVVEDEPRYDIQKAIHASVGATRTLAYSSSDIDRAFGGVDADGTTPIYVAFNNNGGQVLIFRNNLTTPFRIIEGRNDSSWDLNDGAEPTHRYVPYAGVVCHGLIVTACVRWQMSPNSRLGIAIVTSNDLGQTWTVIEDTEGNRTFPDFYVNHPRGAGFCLQNWFPEVEGSALTAWFAVTDYLNRGTGVDDSNGGQTGLVRATRASVNDPWVVDTARLIFQYDSEEGMHFHTAYPIIDLEAGKIGVVTAVGDTVDRNFICLSSMNISSPTDYKTAAITHNLEFDGRQGTGDGVDYGLNAHQFTSAAPGPVRNSALVSSDFAEEVVALILPPDGEEDWSTAKAKIKRVHGSDRETENFAVICKDPLTRTGYVSARERTTGVLNEFFYSADGYNWDEFYYQVSGGDSPYPGFFGNKIVDHHSTGLYTFDIPQTDTRRPLLVGPGCNNRVGTWSTWIAAPAGVTLTKLDKNGQGLYVYPVGHELEGLPLAEQPQTLTEVYLLTCTGESNQIGAYYLTPTGQPSLSASLGCVTYGVFPLTDATCLLNDESNGYETISPSGNQNWFYKAFPNRIPPSTGGRASMMLLNRNGTVAKPLSMLITVVAHHFNGNQFTVGYPVEPLTDKSSVHEVADISLTVDSTWSIKAELGLGVYQYPNPTSTTPLLTIREDDNNYITVFWSAQDELTLSVVVDGAAAVTDTLSVASLRRYPDRNFKLLVSRLANGSTELKATSAGSTIVSVAVSAGIDGTALTTKLGANVDASVVSPLRVFGIYAAKLEDEAARTKYLTRLENV